MSRVPTFGPVGQLGLPIAAAAVGLALWSTGSFAMASAKPTTVSSSIVSSSSDKLSAGGAALAVGIPSVVFGQGDGLPRRLTSPTYQAVFDVWLAAKSPSSVASVSAAGGRVSGCHGVRLKAATVNKLRCTVSVGRAPGVTLTVRTSVAGQPFHATYAHRVG